MPSPHQRCRRLDCTSMVVLAVNCIMLHHIIAPALTVCSSSCNRLPRCLRLSVVCMVDALYCRKRFDKLSLIERLAFVVILVSVLSMLLLMLLHFFYVARAETIQTFVASVAVGCCCKRCILCMRVFLCLLHGNLFPFYPLLFLYFYTPHCRAYQMRRSYTCEV